MGLISQNAVHAHFVRLLAEPEAIGLTQRSASNRSSLCLAARSVMVLQNGNYVVQKRGESVEVYAIRIGLYDLMGKDDLAIVLAVVSVIFVAEGLPINHRRL